MPMTMTGAMAVRAAAMAGATGGAVAAMTTISDSRLRRIAPHPLRLRLAALSRRAAGRDVAA